MVDTNILKHLKCTKSDVEESFFGKRGLWVCDLTWEGHITTEERADNIAIDHGKITIKRDDVIAASFIRGNCDLSIRGTNGDKESTLKCVDRTVEKKLRTG